MSPDVLRPGRDPVSGIKRHDQIFLSDLATEGDPGVADQARRRLAAHPEMTVFQAVRPDHLPIVGTHIDPEPIPPLDSIRQEPDMRQ